MALVAKIKEVSSTQTVDNGDGTTSTVDLSLSGRFIVVADYYDTAKPNVILLTHSFELPVETTVPQAQAIVKEFGQKIRDANVRVNELKVHVGAVIPL